MEVYKFTFNDKTYELGEENFNGFINDEEKPVEGIDEKMILELIGQAEEVSFDTEYYDERCENCNSETQGRKKNFRFLEYHFYVFTLGGKYVISSISKEYEGLSFNKLLKQKRADNSYIVSIIVCTECGSYTIEIQQCEV